MPAPLPRDLRERIVAAIRDRSSMRGAGARFTVGPSSAIKLMATVLSDRELRRRATVGTVGRCWYCAPTTG